MKYLVILAGILFSLSSCNKTTPLPEELPDTLRGIFGNISKYNQFGEEEFNLAGVTLTARCVDTQAVDSVGNATAIFDTTMIALTNDLGAWEFRKCPRGYYTITFSQDGYGDNALYNVWYDTTRGDTLDDIFLAQKIESEIQINSISYANEVIDINRTITFIEQNPSQYQLTTWYFFDTVPQVSKSKYKYAYMAGASIGKTGDVQNLTIQKPIDKLLENGFSEGDSVYVKAYCDNLRYLSYQTGENTWEYPNINASSQVQSFVIEAEQIQE